MPEKDTSDKLPDAWQVQETITMASQAEPASASDANAGPMPEMFGRYRIEKTLGEGAMGAVYLAHDVQLDRKVALKVPKFAPGSDPKLIERFYREARAAATLTHPNICPVFDVGQHNGTHYITMAFIQGHPLSAYITTQNRPSQRSAVRVIHKVALALHEAHQHGIVHRDLKPANVMIDQRNEPIVMDFGLARQLNRNDESRLTQAGTLVGSPAYMSPEQLHGMPQQIGPASDVYSLGVVLYELLTGEIPFQGNGSVMSVISEVLSKEPPDASAVRPDLHPALAAICRKALAKDVGRRYASMEEFATALAEFYKLAASDSGTREPSQATPAFGTQPMAKKTRTSAPGRRRANRTAWQPWLIAVPVILIFAAGIMIVAGSIGRDTTEEEELSPVIQPIHVETPNAEDEPQEFPTGDELDEFLMGGPRGPEPPPPEERTRHLIRRHDEDRDGALGRDELPQHLKGFFVEGDTNSDGVLDLEELKAAPPPPRDDFGHGPPGRGPDGDKPREKRPPPRFP